MLSAHFFPIIGAMKRIACHLIVLLSLTTAQAADETAPAEASASAASPAMPATQRTEPNPDRNRLSNLLQQFDPITEVLQLDTGKEGEQLLAFYRVGGTYAAQGGIIMFPDQQTHMDWPDDLSHLRRDLSDYGWYTLSLFLPDSGRDPLPERTLPVLSAIHANSASATEANTDPTETAPTPTEPATEPDSAAENSAERPPATTEASEPYQEKVLRLGNTAINYLKQQEPKLDRFIVLGVGSGAVWAAQYVHNRQNAEDLSLVMIDPEPPAIAGAPELLKLLPEIEATIIDLHHGLPNRLADNRGSAAEQRLRITRHEGMNNYHQSRLPATAENWKKDNRWLVKQVRGLINTYIIKAKKKQKEKEENQEATEQAPG